MQYLLLFTPVANPCIGSISAVFQHGKDHVVNDRMVQSTLRYASSARGDDRPMNPGDHDEELSVFIQVDNPNPDPNLNAKPDTNPNLNRK